MYGRVSKLFVMLVVQFIPVVVVVVVVVVFVVVIFFWNFFFFWLFPLLKLEFITR